MFKAGKKPNKKGDRLLFFLPLALTLFGLFMIFSASSIAALRDFNDKFYYLKHQGVWVLAGFFLFFFFSRLNLEILKKYSFLGLLISLLLLVLVLIPGIGIEVYGGRRWLELAGFRLQPAELAKLSLVVYFSNLFERKKDIIQFATITGLVLLLVMLEPDLGTVVIIATIAFCLYFVAGAPMKEIGKLIAAGFIIGPLLIFTSPYRKQRLLTFLNSSIEIEGASYHIRQILIALGSGGIFGRGLGQSRQKFLFLPEVTTDSIFAIIAEEFGFVGASILVLLFALLVARGLKVAFVTKDTFPKLLVTGIIVCIGVQAVINLGAMVALVPLTGVPLPFISYGGSSLLICLSGMGIVYNVSRRINY